MAPVALGFETMAAVSGPYVGAANPIRNIAGGGLPWIISSAQGELRADGELTVSVRGLVLAQAEPVPGNLQGVNPAPTFHTVVSCQTVDDAGLQCWPACAPRTWQPAQRQTRTARR